MLRCQKEMLRMSHVAAQNAADVLAVFPQPANCNAISYRDRATIERKQRTPYLKALRSQALTGVQYLAL